MKLTAHKQTLNDWTVENEKRVTLAWITRKTEKSDQGVRFTFFEVRYTKNLGIYAENISHDISPSFQAAKIVAKETIENWLKDDNHE